MAQKLVHSKILALKTTLSEALEGKGAGSILFERRAKGVLVYLSLRREGKQERLKLGNYVDKTLVEWRAYAAATSLEARRFPSIEHYLTAEKERARASQRLADIEARQGTLAQMLDAYVDDMERRGKSSAKSVRGALKLDVLTPFPELSKRKAKEIEPSDVAQILRNCLTRSVAHKGRGVRLTKATANNGKKRQADKLRSYLQAAFAFGLANDLNPLRSGDSVEYGLKTNPARDVPTIEGANRANTWALTKDELKSIVLAVERLPDRRRAIAKAMLYLAGQRVEMLCRVTWPDFYNDGEHSDVLRLLDLKGGRGTPPREHLLPITNRLAEILSPLLALKDLGRAPGPFYLRGTVCIAPGTALDIFTVLGDQLSEQGLTRRFTWRTLRATIETHLAALGVNQERRAWLLSHGRSGVQAKHYDRWNYLPEKRADLDRWARYLDELAGNPSADNVVTGIFAKTA
ncbi:tyrosine-type recombinase/integrase [Pseudomonas sp. NPDC098747]|uniref:tyrosine-type recombinase/integrase n=1 Tax=Pseudomonas sp. NPDC098747 TaxID=3364487 RepID=UPI00383ABA8B